MVTENSRSKAIFGHLFGYFSLYEIVHSLCIFTSFQKKNVFLNPKPSLDYHPKSLTILHLLENSQSGFLAAFQKLNTSFPTTSFSRPTFDFFSQNEYGT